MNIEYTNPNRFDTFIDGQGNKPQFYFRGQSKDYGDSNNIASLLRNNNEDNELDHIRKFPRNAYPKEITSNLQKMIYMQHYGLHTRLLDVTTCFLVALYFATCSDSSDVGVVYCFSNFKMSHGYKQKGVIPQFTQRDDQLENTSLDVEVALAYMQPADKEYIFKASRKFSELIFSNDSSLSVLERRYVFFEIYETLLGNTESSTLEELENALIIEDSVNNANSQPSNYHKAYQLIRPAYDLMLKSPQVCTLLKTMNAGNNQVCNKPIDFTKLFNECFFVTAKQINPRVRAQYGEFMFQPFPETTSISSIHDFIVNQYNPQKITVPAIYKDSIQKELRCLGYSQETLFPDEKSIGDKYRKKINSINNYH